MDLRVESIFKEELQGDTSFLDKGSGLSRLFGKNTYIDMDMRKTWHNGIKYGIEIGLRKSSLKGQRIELDNSAKEPRQEEFLKRFYSLCEEYNCSVQYHQVEGMKIMDLKR